jgi:hypothetical protein
MANCLNCKKELGCSCKRRVASNGVSCCGSCITSIENNSVNKPNSVGVITSVTAVANLT